MTTDEASFKGMPHMKRLCSKPRCGRPHVAKGLCGLHYERVRILSKPTCSVDKCNNKAEKRGWCGKHYYRWRTNGAPLAGRTENGQREAFLRDFAPPKTDFCIEWPFSKSGHGYGAKIGARYPHQIVCNKFHGLAPSPSHEVAHGCGNRLCINPKHLRWALHVENEADKLLHGTHRSQIVKRAAA